MILLRNYHFYCFNTNPRLPPFLPVRCKSGITFVRRCFRDETNSGKISLFSQTIFTQWKFNSKKTRKVISTCPCSILRILMNVKWQFSVQFWVHRWAYSIPIVHRRPSVRPQCLNIFSETTGRIKAKFFEEPPWVRGTKFCSRHLGHMTKMAATPIYGKNP